MLDPALLSAIASKPAYYSMLMGFERMQVASFISSLASRIVGPLCPGAHPATTAPLPLATHLRYWHEVLLLQMFFSNR